MKEYEVSFAKNQADLLAAKNLDDTAFGPHLGITLEELEAICQNGRVILLRDANGRLVGESQVITAPIPQHPHLASDEAYNYGTAISPELQNQGLARILFQAQEEVAVAAGKTRSTLTVRLENAQSLAARFKLRFQITGYDSCYYGPLETGGARFLMEKTLNHNGHFVPKEVLAKKFIDGQVWVVDESNVETALATGTTLIGVPITPGDDIDFSAHRLVKQIFSRRSYRGVGLLKLEPKSLLILASYKE